MADFSTLDTVSSTPKSFYEAEQDGLGLTRPDKTLSGSSRGIQNLGNNTIQLDNENNRILVKDDTAVPRLAAGSDSIKLSQATYDVTTATDDQLIWSSAFNSFKIVATGTIITPAVSLVDGGAGVWDDVIDGTTITHSLGYRPGIVAYVEYSSGNHSPLPYIDTGILGAGTVYTRLMTIEVSDSTITAIAQASGLHTSIGLPASTVRYYLLRETAN